MSKRFTIIALSIIINAVVISLFLINKEVNNLHLSNALFNTSILFLGVGAYSYVAQKGMFSSLSYFKRRVINLYLLKEKREDLPNSLYEHHINIIEKYKRQSFYFLVLLIGTIDFSIAIYITYILDTL